MYRGAGRVIPQSSGPPRSIAIVRLSAIGDTVHVLPVIASLRRAWPGTSITWVIQPEPLELYRGRPDVDDFLVFDRALGARAYLDFRRRTRGRSFDLVLDVHPYFKAGLVSRMLEAPIRLGYDRVRARDLTWLFTNRRIPARPAQHVQDQYFEFLDHLGVETIKRWNFFFTEAEHASREAYFETVGRPVLALVLRSSSPDKDWILERYARVVEVAREDLGYQPLVVGGASRGELADATRLRELSRSPLRVELRNDLRRLAWLLDGSSLALSPDTGPLHMAVALETPTIGLFGATDPKRSGPYERYDDLLIDRYTRDGETRPSRVRRSGNMERISVNDVLEKLERARSVYGDGGES